MHNRAHEFPATSYDSLRVVPILIAAISPPTQDLASLKALTKEFIRRECEFNQGQPDMTLRGYTLAVQLFRHCYHHPNFDNLRITLQVREELLPQNYANYLARGKDKDGTKLDPFFQYSGEPTAQPKAGGPPTLPQLASDLIQFLGIFHIVMLYLPKQRDLFDGTLPQFKQVCIDKLKADGKAHLIAEVESITLDTPYASLQTFLDKTFLPPPAAHASVYKSRQTLMGEAKHKGGKELGEPLLNPAAEPSGADESRPTKSGWCCCR